MLPAEIAEAIAAEIESQMAAQAEKDHIPVWQEYANMLSAFHRAGALWWIIAAFGMYAVWVKYLH